MLSAVADPCVPLTSPPGSGVAERGGHACLLAGAAFFAGTFFAGTFFAGTFFAGTFFAGTFFAGTFFAGAFFA